MIGSSYMTSSFKNTCEFAVLGHPTSQREALFILPVGVMVMMAMTMMVVTEMLHQPRFRYPFAKIELRPRPLEELV